MRILDRSSLLATFAVLLPLAGGPASPTAAGTGAGDGVTIATEVAVAESRPCDGPDVDPWVTEHRDRVVAYNVLARFAIVQYGEPISCEGSVTMEFDGVRFGTVTLGFAGGIEVQVETMPPESSATTLTSEAGLADEADVRAAVERHATGIGMRIDWTTPQSRVEGADVVHQYWDPEPGLNASASLTLRGGRLVAVRVSLAL